MAKGNEMSRRVLYLDCAGGAAGDMVLCALTEAADCAAVVEALPSALGFSDITMNQMHYLETIAMLSNPTSGDLADSLSVTRPSVSAIVKKLIETGYLTKTKSKIDGRVYYLHLTDKGFRFNELHSEIHQILARRIIENLNQDEIEMLAGLLGKLTNE